MMMDKLRSATNSLAAKILLTIITISFVLSGVAGYVFSQVDTSAVKVNGEEISQQVFQQQYNAEYQRLSEQLGAQFDVLADSPQFMQGLRNNVLNQLVDQELLRQYVNELKLGVSDNRIKQQIVAMEAFQTNGKFDNNLYQQMLARNNISADTYASYVRAGLQLEQLQLGVLGTDFVVPAQQQELAKLLFQTRDVRLANLPLAEEIKQQTVSNEEIQQYYDNNKSAFMIPELVKVQYLDLSREDVEKNIQVSDVEIAQYYQDNKAQFVSQGQQRLSHIQLATEQDANEVYQALQQGADFAELAKSRSMDKLSGQNGGDLSWVVVGELPKALEDAANSLDVGQYSQPIRVDNAFHIVKVTDRKAAAELPLEQVKTQIADQVRQDLVNAAFYKTEKAVAEKAFENPTSLVEAEKVSGVKLVETPVFSRSDVPAELNYPNIVSALFDTDLVNGGANSEPMSVGELHSIVFRVVEHKPEGVRSLDEAKADIEALLKRQKAEAKVLAKAQEEVVALNNQGNANNSGLAFGSKETLTYAQNTDPALNEAIFSMPKPVDNKFTYFAAKGGNGDVVVVELQKVEEGKVNEQEQAAFNLQLSQTQQQELQTTLLQALRNKAKIEVNDSFINQTEE
ncbi:peptidylprolyl isomerase [Conservatibacter flavescens]|uniref:Periplasmic chaperone PpiD n=1 Tax=Conservatibacter flavescens TaxID=28161 RepID=A0A2M8S1J7_9PAST|nr:peptidylprolyl isomerase [Conservatibacter flavescens]PJG85031.1 peptidylprolyl isomerase [Conservatibacter flavescens]